MITTSATSQKWEKKKTSTDHYIMLQYTSFATVICSNSGHDTSAKLSPIKKKFTENQKNEKNC